MYTQAMSDRSLILYKYIEYVGEVAYATTDAYR